MVATDLWPLDRWSLLLRRRDARLDALDLDLLRSDHVLDLLHLSLLRSRRRLEVRRVRLRRLDLVVLSVVMSLMSRNFAVVDLDELVDPLHLLVDVIRSQVSLADFL